jgi:parallel beta-helix repeat protein
MYSIWDSQIGMNKWLQKGNAEIFSPQGNALGGINSSIGLVGGGVDSTDPNKLASGEAASILAYAKKTFTDTTEGWMQGLDTDNKYKWILGDGTSGIDWGVTAAGTLTVMGVITASAIHIPDEDTTANSFHVESDGDTWWGCTQTNWTADNNNANAYVLSSGVAQFQSVTLTGSVIATDFQPGTDIAIQGWSSSLEFVASDYRTVTWSAGGTGVIIVQDGTDYTITAGTTGNMAALTYIYFDVTAPTVLAITTDKAVATGKGKILVCVAENNADTSSKAQFQALGGYGGNNLFVENLAANSASTNEFVSNTAQIKDLIVTNAKINDLAVDKLTAGSITSKAITLAVAAGTGDSKIQAGKTDFGDDTAGFILGIDDGVVGDPAKFEIGDSTYFLKFDGTNISVKANKSNLQLYETVVDAAGDGDYTTVGAAITDGKTRIFVRSGTYAEAGAIALPNGATITGEDPKNTIISAGKFTIAGDTAAYTAGTVSVTVNTTTVTGIGTSWLANVAATDLILISEVWHEIASVDLDTQITLTRAYRGQTVAGVNYATANFYTDIIISGITITGNSGQARGIDAAFVKGLVIENCILKDIGDSVAGGYAIYTNYCIDSDIVDNFITGMLSNATEVVYLARGYNIKVEGNRIVDNRHMGIRLHSGNNIIVQNNLVANNGYYGIYANLTNISIVNNYCLYNNVGIWIDSSGGGCISSNFCNYNSSFGLYSDGQDCVIDGNEINNNGDDGIKISQNSDRVTVSNNQCIDNAGEGIYTMNNGSDVTVVGNCCFNNGANGIYADARDSNVMNNICNSNTTNGIYTQKGININNNTCKDNGGDGIQLDTNDVQCIGNYCESNTGDGIEINGAARDEMLINSNTCRGNTGWGILFDNNPTSSTCVGNMMKGNTSGNLSGVAGANSQFASNVTV